MLALSIFEEFGKEGNTSSVSVFVSFRGNMRDLEPPLGKLEGSISRLEAFRARIPGVRKP